MRGQARCAWLLALAAAAAAQQHVCDPVGCNVCDECCRFVGNQTAKCEACVAMECHICEDAAQACSRLCVKHCWSELITAPCIRDCVGCNGLWLLLAVAIPYGGRLVVDFLLGELCESARLIKRNQSIAEQPLAGGSYSRCML